MEKPLYHIPVLLTASIDYLVEKPDGIYVDCTTGGGGHSAEILNRINKNGMLVCLDADPEAVQFAQHRLESYPNKIIRQIFYDQLDAVLVEENLLPANGFLFDLGISSHHVDTDERGFSFQKDGPLDMRFHTSQRLTAADVVNEYPRERLEQIFREYGEERFSGRIARVIVEARHSEPFRSTAQLTAVIAKMVSGKFLNKSLARIFQAIRIEVNDELNRLRSALEKAFECLDENGNMVVIAYHSLEAKIVKDFFREKERDCICPPEFPQCVCSKVSEMKVITRKAIQPSPAEIEMNPRARSARLRAAMKIVPYQGIR